MSHQGHHLYTILGGSTMNAVKNNKLSVVYRGYNDGTLLSCKWDDGSMRHHTLEFMGRDSSGMFVHYKWNEISIFSFDGDTIYFEGVRSDGRHDIKRIHDIKDVEVL